jgi:hypothetical protein
MVSSSVTPIHYLTLIVSSLTQELSPEPLTPLPDRARSRLRFHPGIQGGAGNGTISNHVKRLSSASARPTEIPQVRVSGGIPHKNPTGTTAFPGTRRHTC